jgi:hypothetical protein
MPRKLHGASPWQGVASLQVLAWMPHLNSSITPKTCANSPTPPKLRLAHALPNRMSVASPQTNVDQEKIGGHQWPSFKRRSLKKYETHYWIICSTCTGVEPRSGGLRQNLAKTESKQQRPNGAREDFEQEHAQDEEAKPSHTSSQTPLKAKYRKEHGA